MSWNDLRKGRYSQMGGEYLITFVCQNRVPIFTNPTAAQTFCRQISLNENQSNSQWLTWVLMPDHFHGLLQLGECSLSKTIAHLKGLTAKKVNECLGRNGTLWQSAFHDHALRAEEDRKDIARYIVANPLRAGLVKTIKQYPYWDSVYL